MQCSLIGNEKRDDVDRANRDAGISGFRPVPTTDTDGVELSQQSSISNEESAPAAGRITCGSLLVHNLMPDEGLFVTRHSLSPHVKFLKLVVIVILMTFLTQKISCTFPGWWCEEFGYGMAEYFTYYWGEQCCDLFLIFVVGRMYERRGADTPLFLLACFAGAILPSAQEQISFLRVSFSQYAIMCQWQPGTFVFFVLVVIVMLGIIILHVRHAIAIKAIVSWAAELLIVILILVVPNINDSAFHIHHWFFCLIVAMFARFDPPWSVAVQAFMIGYYLNGIAIYGRHPTLACKYVFFLNDQQGCQLIKNVTNGSAPHYVQPDPYNCTGDYARRSLSRLGPP